MASPRWPSPAQSCACCSRNASAHPPTRVFAGKRACKNIAPSAGALACVFILLEPAQRASATITCLQAMLANKAARPCNRVTFAIISAARAGAADASATSAAAFPIRHETPLRRHERPAAQREPQQSIRISPFTKRKSGVNEKGGGTRGWCRRLCCGRVFACGARYASSSRPAASSWSSSASAASRLTSFANTYSLIFGSVPLGRTITLLPPSTSNSTTLAAGRPFTPCW